MPEREPETEPGHAMRREAACPLCRADGGRVLVGAPRWRIVLADDVDHPAFTRVVWRAHVAEMSDLPESDRRELFDVVMRVEAVQRRALAPDKINLASLGNQVPHLHWHVVPRWRDDRHFPDSVWSAPRSSADPASPAAARSAVVRTRLDDYVARLREAFADR